MVKLLCTISNTLLLFHRLFYSQFVKFQFLSHIYWLLRTLRFENVDSMLILLGTNIPCSINDLFSYDGFPFLQAGFTPHVELAYSWYNSIFQSSFWYKFCFGAFWPDCTVQTLIWILSASTDTPSKKFICCQYLYSFTVPNLHCDASFPHNHCKVYC